jgi:tetratricopeptide (TPR) repeat protein
LKGLPEDPEVYFWRGRAKQEQDKDKDAIKDFDKTISLKPDYGDAYYWRGHSYSEMDMLKESACPDFVKAAELGSELGTKAQKKYCGVK